jgi:cell division protein YceG involved in septum cleavage
MRGKRSNAPHEQPAVTDYLFFVADCDPDQLGAHRFSATYEAHLEEW